MKHWWCRSSLVNAELKMTPNFYTKHLNQRHVTQRTFIQSLPSQHWLSKAFFLRAAVLTRWRQVSLALTGHGWLAQRVGMEGGHVVSWRVQALNEQSVDLALILIGSKLSFGSPDGWQEARPGTLPRRKRDDITFTGYVRTHSRTQPLFFWLCVFCLSLFGTAFPYFVAFECRYSPSVSLSFPLFLYSFFFFYQTHILTQTIQQS